MLRARLGWVKQTGVRRLFIYAVMALVLGFALFYHSGNTPSGLSKAESAARNSGQSFSAIHSNPINAPHQMVIFGLHRLGFNGLAALRFSSAVFAILFVLAFYSLARSWFGKTVGMLSTPLLFGTPLFIVAARQTSAEIMLFSPILVIALYNWLIRTKTHKNLAWICLIAASGLLIYTPGLVWWLAAAAIISRRNIIVALASVPRWLAALGIIIFAVILVPAGISIFQDWHLVREFAAIPAHWRPPLLIIKSLVWMLAGLLVRMPYHSPLIIGRLPILDIVQIGLLVFGLYAMWTAARAKTLALAGSIAFAILAAGINDNPLFLALGLPAIAIFGAAGLRYLYIEWRGVFPNNPIPKSLALVLIATLAAVQLAYGLTYATVAWPHTLDTKTSYVLK